MECKHSTPPHVCCQKLANSGLISMDGCKRIEKKKNK